MRKVVNVGAKIVFDAAAALPAIAVRIPLIAQFDVVLEPVGDDKILFDFLAEAGNSVS